MKGEVVEVNGHAGDVMLAHPFLLHARSKNLGQHGAESVRFMCHPAVPLVKPMDFDKVRGVALSKMSRRSPAFVYRGSWKFATSCDDRACSSTD